MWDSGGTPFTTLLANAALEMACDLRPFLRAILGDKLHDKGILFFCPRTLDELRIEHLGRTSMQVREQVRECSGMHEGEEQCHND